MKFKTFSFKSVSTEGVAENEFAGYAAVFGNVDEHGEIIQKGAFAKAVPGFLKDGFIAWQHDWDNPIGKPLEAYEDDKGLFIRAKLSDTQKGNEARTLIMDNVVQKLSIGYEIEAYSMLSDEQATLLLGEQGYQQAKDNLPWWRDQVCLLTQINPLYEVSPVSVPANGAAQILAAKGIDGFIELPHSKQAEAVGSMVQAYLKRTSWKASERAKEKRKLSDAHLKTLQDLLSGFKASAKDIEELLTELGQEAEQGSSAADETANLADPAELEKAFSNFAQTCARIAGATQ